LRERVFVLRASHSAGANSPVACLLESAQG